MKSRRSAGRQYTMTVRARAAEATGRRIIDAMASLFTERPYASITLEAVAARAGVTLQTVLRRFGSKAGLLAAVAKDGASRVAEQRGRAVPGDLRGAVKNLSEHYEAWGDVAMRLLAEEDRVAELAPITREARALHHAWVDRVFAPELARRRGRARILLRAQLVAACDVYVWKIFRRDLSLSRVDTERATQNVLEGILGLRGGAR